MDTLPHSSTFHYVHAINSVYAKQTLPLADNPLNTATPIRQATARYLRLFLVGHPQNLTNKQI